MTTMADVARLAGVSATTVSHVLNGTRPVAPATEQAVRRAVSKTGYRHNLAARALATQSTDTVGLAMSVVTNPFFAELVRNIERRLRDAGYTLILADTADDPSVALNVTNHLLARRVSGLVVSPLEDNRLFTRAVKDLLAQRFPLVLLDRRSNLAADQVYSECVEATYSLTMHLASLGHTRIGYVMGANHVMSTRDRLAGYRKAVRDAGLATDPRLILAGESDEQITTRAVLEHFAGGRRTTTGLVVSNNQMTLGVMRALRRLGMRIPRDLAIVSYDDLDWADLATPPLTAMAQDHAALAAHATELLLARLRDPDRAPQTVVVPTTFHHRTSCGCHKRPTPSAGVDGARSRSRLGSRPST